MPENTHMKKVVVHSALPEPLLQQLRQHFEVAYFPQIDETHRAAFLHALGEAQGLLGTGLTVDRSLLAAAPALKAVATITVGYDNYDLPYLNEHGILLTNTPDVLSEATADLVFSLMLATARRVVELADWVRAGEWRANIGPAQYGVNVYGKTLGMLGLGRIGQAIARRARLGFGMNILYYNRSPVPAAETTLQARRLPLEEVLAQSDFVCVILPLTPSTVHLMGAREFSLMKRSAIFINGARGRIVDEAALIDALRKDIIHAAGLDVFEQEPLPVDSPLLAMKNVVALPHAGSATHETRYAMAQLAVENLIAALEGRPQNLVPTSTASAAVKPH